MSSGGAASGRTGARYEREIVSVLRQCGYGALRFAASGAATTRSVGDILAAREHPGGGTELWGIELKSGKETTLYVDGPEVSKLGLFCRRWNAEVFLGARFTTRGSPTTHYLVKPEDARKTDGGNYGLPIDDIEERASIAIHPGDEPDVEEVGADA